MILCIDLAARFSAGVLASESGTVLREFDSWGMSPVNFVRDVATYGADADVILVEDVPYGISNQAMVKPVLRLQGMLIAELIYANLLQNTLFVNPATWQRDMGVYGKKSAGAEAAAVALGYVAPDMLDHHSAEWEPLKGAERSKVRAQLKKATTDYNDAFLMCEWGLGQNDLRSISGVQPVMI